MLGFGFVFRAIDDGLKASMLNVGAGFRGLSDAASKTGDVMRDAFAMLSLSNIQTQLEAITGGSVQLVNSLEAEFFEMGKTAKVALAGIGLRGAELNKEIAKGAGLAHKYQVGIEGITKSQVALHHASIEARDALKMMGMNLEGLVKFEKATGQTGDQLVGTVQNLATSYGFSSKQIKSFMDDYAKVSQITGTAQKGFEDLGKNLTNIDAAFASMGSTIEDQPAEVRKYLLETQKLSGVFRLFNGDMESAQDASSEFTNFLLENRKALSLAKNGLEDMPQAFQDMATATGDSTKAMELFEKGPEEALKGLIAMRKEIVNSKNAEMLQKFDKNLEVIGKGSLTFLAQGGERASKELAKLNKTVAGTTGGLKDLTKAAQPAIRTLDQKLEDAAQKFDRRLHSLSGGSKGFLRTEQKTFKASLDQIKKMTKDPVWGLWTKNLVNARRTSMFAFFRPVSQSAKELVEDQRGIAKAMGKNGLLGRLEAIKRLGVAGAFIDLEKAIGGKKGFNKALEKANEEVEKFQVHMKTAKTVLETITPGVGTLGVALGGLFVAAKILTPIFALFKLILGSKLVVGTLGVLGTAIGSVVSAIGGFATIAIVGLAAVGAFFIGLGALFAMPEKHQDSFLEWLEGLIPSIDDWSKAVEEFDVQNAVVTLEVLISDIIDGVGDAIGGMFDLGNFLFRGIEPPEKNAKLVKGLGKFFKAVGKLIKTIAKKSFEFFGAFISNQFKVMEGHIAAAAIMLHDNIARDFKEVIDGPVGDFALKLGQIFDIKKIIEGGLKGIKKVLYASFFLPVHSFFMMMIHVVHKLMDAMFLTPVELLIQHIGGLLAKIRDTLPTGFFDKVMTGTGLDPKVIDRFQNFEFKADDRAKNKALKELKDFTKEKLKEGGFSKDGKLLGSNTASLDALNITMDKLTRVLEGKGSASASIQVPVAIQAV